jgi:hypothetical protein
MKPVRAVFDEDDQGPPAGEMFRNDLRVTSKRDGLPPLIPQSPDQIVAADSGRIFVDQASECIRVDNGASPVPHHHRHGGAAAQRLGLGNEGNVENRERRRWLGRSGLRQRRQKNRNDASRQQR